MKNKFYTILCLLCGPVMTYAQVPSRVYSTVQCFPGGNLRVHSNPMSFGAHIITPRSNPGESSVFFADDAFSDGTSDAGYVNGYVTRIGSEPFSFPVGDQQGEDVRSMTLSLSNPTPIRLSVAYWKGDPGTALDPTGGPHDTKLVSSEGELGVSKLTVVSKQGFWDWVPLAVPAQESEIRIEVSIVDHSAIEGYEPENIRLVGWNNTAGMWVNLSGDIAPATNTDGTIVIGTLTTSTMSEYSAITVGSVSEEVLPVTLISFNARKEGNQVNLDWRTAEEINADYFQIERSANAKDWNVIGKQSAVGESKALLEYAFMDTSPLRGSNYYRLKMVDNDQTFAYSKVLTVSFEGSTNFLTMYPNPVSDVLHFKDADLQKIQQVTIHNISGIRVYQSGAVSQEGVHVGKLANGIYLVTVKLTDGNSRTEKIVINH
ncbi:T9SS type A sorting domain-containing protein [Dyadobacter sp. CY347]|uniref:T9SS type A sorting domain-containing protein n=1 Tax=Dyadobacter sp. CY347 TaxID=2909336 RepID=UPI001F15FD32|nr:T9SS type A sorting domain-containing protein [Dyadobacter sp. CY347]MCF2491468.1 T9SS type A sorting domain-containing protein [Dyadobacter sp. CY347]